MNFTPERITTLEPHQILVFGSNTEGRHGAGVAKLAMKFGAMYRQSAGLMGQTYAIVTKDLSKGVRSIPLDQIRGSVNGFLLIARNSPKFEFLVTPIGCGLAGYKPEEIAPFFKPAVEFPDKYPNVRLPKVFWDALQ